MTTGAGCSECGAGPAIAELRTAIPGTPAANTASRTALCRQCLTLPWWHAETGDPATTSANNDA